MKKQIKKGLEFGTLAKIMNLKKENMKKIFLIGAMAALSFNGVAQERKCENLAPETYCIVSNHGRHYITHDGVKEDKDVKLMNGNIIHSEGVIETRDHFIVMHPNQCIRMDNFIVIFTEEPIARRK